METIGDAYMVASGLPIRNCDKHVVEIPNMALSIPFAPHFFKVKVVFAGLYIIFIDLDYIVRVLVITPPV